jgi:serine protease Do
MGSIAEDLRRATVEVAEAHSGGSGVVWSADGKIITNAHVVRGRNPAVRLWDGSTYPAEILAFDSRRDLALLRVPRQDLPAPPFRDSSQVAPGEFVMAVGNPLGFTGAVSTGVVHAVGRVQGRGRRPYIRASVRLAPGNSGGPLADSQGRVIGINTMVLYGSGLGLAVPSNTVAEFVRQGPAPARLGVTVKPVPLRRGLGLVVVEVSRGSPAENASLQPGDILIGVEGRSLEDPDDLASALDAVRGPLRLQFYRKQARVREVTVRT